MRALLAALVAAVALAPAGLPVSTAQAAAPMCQGKEATILDEDGGEVDGTEGDDVIVASGPRTRILAKAGNDTICVREAVVFAGPGHDSVQARGSDEDEYLAIWEGEDLDIDLGRDSVALYFSHGGSGTISAESGATLDVVTGTSVEVDLENGDLALDADTASYVVDGFDHVIASSPSVVVKGNGRDNFLRVTRLSCETTVKGGRGHDELRVMGNIHELPEFDCPGERRHRLYGQRGNDTLRGKNFDEVLIGGRGRDLAEGSRGSDRCRAETEKGCER